MKIRKSWMSIVRIVITHKRLMQQNWIVSLQSNRESLRKVLSLFIISRGWSDSVAQIELHSRFTAGLGPEFPTLSVETDRTLAARRSAAYLACFLHAGTPPSQKLSCSAG